MVHLFVIHDSVLTAIVIIKRSVNAHVPLFFGKYYSRMYFVRPNIVKKTSH